MRRLIKTIHIKAEFAWTDWDLYEKPGVVVVAQKLNEQLERLVNGDNVRREVEEGMLEFMRDFSVYGANDTEPRAHLQKVLDEIYGED